MLSPGREEKETHYIGYPQGCVEPSGEIIFMYVGVHGGSVLVTFRQVTADTKFIWHAGLLGLDGYKERRAEDGAT